MLDALDIEGSNDVGDGLITFMSAMAMAKGVQLVVFDRGGFTYAGKG